MASKTEKKDPEKIDDFFRESLSLKIKELRGDDTNHISIAFHTDLTVSTVQKAEKKIGIMMYDTFLKFIKGTGISPCDILPQDTYPVTDLPMVVIKNGPDISEALSSSNIVEAIERFADHAEIIKTYEVSSNKKEYKDKRSKEIMLLGNRIRAVREAREMEVSELAEASNMATQNLFMFEIGARTPRMDAVIRIARALKVRIDFIVANEGDVPEVLLPHLYEHHLRTIASSVGSLKVLGEHISYAIIEGRRIGNKIN